MGAYHAGARRPSRALGRYGKGIYELVSQLPCAEQEGLIRRLLRYSRLAAEKLA